MGFMGSIFKALGFEGEQKVKIKKINNQKQPSNLKMEK